MTEQEWLNKRYKGQFPFTSSTTCSFCGELLFNCKHAYKGIAYLGGVAQTCNSPRCVGWLRAKIRYNIQARTRAQFQSSLRESLGV